MLSSISTSTEKKPVAVVDSGIGGISVLRELVALMPYEDFIFFGDEANAPYGTKTPEQVKEITFRNVDMLLSEYRAKAAVIACNTATGAAVSPLRRAYPEIPIIGIEPEIKSAALMSEHPRVLIMATPLTLRQPKFITLRERFEKNAEFISLPCPGLMELIENGHIDDELLHGYLTSLFSGLDDRHFDAVVLGCTHYPHVRESISGFFPDAAVFDGCHGTAAEARRRLSRAGLLCQTQTKGVLKFITTSDNPDFEKTCLKLMSR